MAITIEFAAYDGAGAPLTGLTPVWNAKWDAVAEAAYAPAVAFSELAGGLYKFTKPDGIDLTGFIDLTAAATPRYLPVIARTVGIVPGLDGPGAPLTGLSPTFSILRNVVDNSVITPPSIAELGTTGLYKFTLTDPLIQAGGIVDLAGAAAPRYIQYDSGDGVVPPVISGITPTAGVIPGNRATALQTPIEFDVVDVEPGLRMVLVSCKYALDASTLVAHDGSNFLPPFDSTTSERTAITDGFHFKFLPKGGWAGDFLMFVYAVDSGGELEGSLP